MAKITHSDMRRGTVPTQSERDTLQNFVVDDLSSEPSVDDKLAAFEGGMDVVFVPPAPKISENDQKRLESLIFMGRYSREFDIAGHKFEISTLTHKENNEIMSRLMKIGDAADIFTVRILTLACAIKNVDGVSLDSVNIAGEFASVLEKKMAIIDQMQLALVERLYTSYETLINESNEVVFGEKIKK